MPASPNAWWSARARWPSTSKASLPSWACPRPKATIGGSWQCCGSWKARAPPSGADLTVCRGVSARLRERGAGLGTAPASSESAARPPGARAAPSRERREGPAGHIDDERLAAGDGDRYREHGSTGWSRLILNQGCGVVGERPRTRRRGRGPERRVSNDSRTVASAHTSGSSLPAPARKHPQARYLGRHPRRRERRATQTPPRPKMHLRVVIPNASE